MPPNGELEHYSRLSAGKLYELVMPTKDRPIPPVRSIKVPNLSANKQGVRLIVLESLLAYLKNLESAGGVPA